jgi:MYXO-CTERM domain-containing protein
MKKCLLVLGCWSVLIPLAHASPITLFDTIDGVTGAGPLLNYQAGYYSDVASSFSTLNSPFVLQDVALELGPGANDAGILNVYLYPDTGSIAPNLSATPILLGSISDSALFAAGGLEVYNFMADITLQADTRYWIDVNAWGNSDVPSTSTWGHVTTLAGTIGATNEYNWDERDNTYADTTDGGLANQMTVTGTDTPEPATSLLGALGLGALALLRRRRPTV